MSPSDTPLAIDGGMPVRTAPLPWELPGAAWIGAEEAELVQQVIAAQSPFRYYGPDPQHMVERLEAAFARRLGRRHVVGVNSGTAALGIAMGALGVGPGDEVLVPGYLWVSCLSAVVRAGAIPRPVDIDDTMCMDPADLEAKINDRTRAVLLVHMSGTAGHLDRIVDLCRARGLPLIEDCAQAAGASFQGKPLGSWGDLSIFSFQLNKNMTAGEGGLVTCDDDDLYRRCFALHDLGYARRDGRLDTGDESCQLWGVGARMSELTGAMLLAQEAKLDRITGNMRQAKWAIRQRLADIPGLAFRNVRDPEGDSGPFLITLYPSPEIAQRFTEALRAEGIAGPAGSLACIPMTQWGLHWTFNNASLTRRQANSRDGFPWSHPANAFHADIDYSADALPGCQRIHDHGALLTVASTLTEADIDDIVAAFHKVAAHLLPG